MSQKTFVNLTMSPITLVMGDATRQTIEPRMNGPGPDEGLPMPAFVEMRAGVPMGSINGVPCYGPATYGIIQNLPSPAADTVYLVDHQVRRALNLSNTRAHYPADIEIHRRDCVCPGIGSDGQNVIVHHEIVAATRLVYG